MNRNFINFSNHRSDNWSKEQWLEARRYGQVIDYPFPGVSPDTTENVIEALAEDVVSEIVLMEPAAVMCQGEFTLTYKVIEKLKNKGIKCLAACSKRKTREHVNVDGSISKESEFKFIRFREY